MQPRASRCATSSSTSCGKLQLPTLLVTHAFEDANALSQRIAVLDNGRLVQFASPSELLRNPATAMVAALTGANVLHGVATRTPRGSTVVLDGGGELPSDTPAEGAVQIAIHPWELEITDPHSSTLSDRVISVRPHEGALRIRLNRFVVHAQAEQAGDVAITEGSQLGLRAAPADVRVLAPRDPLDASK